MLKQPTLSALALILLVLPGCATFTPATDGSCQIFKPISNSTKDTERTRREVIGHNRVYGAICKSGGTPWGK